MKSFDSSMLIKTILLASLLLSSACNSQNRTAISKESLDEMFENIAIDTQWDLTKPMLWGYFFTDRSKDKLERSAPLLVAKGYRLVNIYLADKEEPSEADLWWLHVEKVEIHTVDSLHNRNIELYRFASEQGIDSYDGMDVGPVAKLN
jgi:hypothetical protein